MLRGGGAGGGDGDGDGDGGREYFSGEVAGGGFEVSARWAGWGVERWVGMGLGLRRGEGGGGEKGWLGCAVVQIEWPLGFRARSVEY